MYKMIFWDVDGTLINFKEAERNAMRAAFDTFGYGICDDSKLLRYSLLNESYWKRIEKGEDKKKLLVNRFVEFFREEGLPTDRASEFNRFYQYALGETVVYNDDSYELVRSMQGKIPQYALTNGTITAQENKIKKAGFDMLLDGVFISETTGYDKPADGFYRYVFERVPACEKVEILMIGDSLTSDMRGAVEQGLTAVWYNPGGQDIPGGMKIDYEIRNLQQVRAILSDSIAF